MFIWVLWNSITYIIHPNTNILCDIRSFCIPRLSPIPSSDDCFQASSSFMVCS